MIEKLRMCQLDGNTSNNNKNNKNRQGTRRAHRTQREFTQTCNHTRTNTVVKSGPGNNARFFLHDALLGVVSRPRFRCCHRVVCVPSLTDGGNVAWKKRRSTHLGHWSAIVCVCTFGCLNVFVRGKMRRYDEKGRNGGGGCGNDASDCTTAPEAKTIAG
jgi:hypothetical protein